MAGTLYALLTDQLGSTNMSYRADGGDTRTQRYYPWGTIRPGPANTLPTDHTFTGQKLDSSIGLLYYSDSADYGRYYDSTLGRFTQPDSIVPNPGNPQDLNRYSYVRNNPLKYADPTGHCFGLALGIDTATCIAIGTGGAAVASRVGPLVVEYGPQAIQFVQAYGDKLPALWDRTVQFAREAGNRIQGSSQGGNTADPGGLDPNDPFRNAAESIRQGIETLRRQISNPRNYAQYRYGAQANLSRAEYYYRQGTLRSVNPTGRGSIDLILTNNTGVEVKYWQAQTVFDDTRVLADQFQGFNKLGLDRIVVEFVQTQRDPVTQAVLAELQQQLAIEYGMDLSNFVFRVIPNPGIP